MITKDIKAADVFGRHTNYFAQLVQLACEHNSEIHLSSNNKNINAKSIMGVMAFKLEEGDPVTITAEGPDEAEAINAIEAFLS